MNTPENHKQLLNFLLVQDRVFGSIYNDMAKELSSVLRLYKVNSKSSVWHKNPEIKKKVNAVLSKYRTKIYDNISASTATAWNLSNNHNDSLVTNYTKGINIPERTKKNLYSRNAAALKAFQSRTQGKLKLSDRVWSLTNQTRAQLESFISEGLTTGRSASSLAVDLQRYLKEPERRFRRLRNPETGKLVISDPAKNYNPGRGVYRSSYKNALRLARNEINIAYRTSDHERRKQLPFILGIKVNLSPAHPQYDICDELQGEYPKEFNFTGWHPNCLCFTTTKLLSKKEFIGYLNGKSIPANKYVKQIPIRSSRYITENADRLKGLSNTPYFIQDNFKPTVTGYEINKEVGVPVPKIQIPKNILVDNLRKSGVTVNYNEKTFREFNKNAKGFKFQNMFYQLENELSKSGIKNINKSVYLKNTGFEFRLSARNFEMKREVFYGEKSNSVYHAYLRLPKTTQGSGLTKKMFQTLYKEYESGNIKRIDVTANIDIGGYAWARYGFSATKKSEVMNMIKNSNNKTWASKALAKARYHYKRYGNDKPFPMRRLTTIEGGKKELLGSFWSGTIDLNNDKEKKWFQEYLFR